MIGNRDEGQKTRRRTTTTTTGHSSAGTGASSKKVNSVPKMRTNLHNLNTVVIFNFE